MPTQRSISVASKDLPAPAVVAAFLDAQGRSREEIASAAGITPDQVSRYRQRDDYQAVRLEWQERSLSRVEDLVTTARTEILGAGIAALKTGVEALAAVESDGGPDWPIRLRAFEKLVGEMRTLVDKQDEGQRAGALAGAHAAVTLVIRRDGDGPPVIEHEAV